MAAHGTQRTAAQALSHAILSLRAALALQHVILRCAQDLAAYRAGPFPFAVLRPAAHSASQPAHRSHALRGKPYLQMSAGASFS